MGLSSKQVSSDGSDWNQALLEGAKTLEYPKMSSINRQHDQQQQQQHHQNQNQHQNQHEQLKCPRCESTNTKFCYYNNYNKSQPRHFCKACKRHWTKGGTLRNVPEGGGRKNKRLKLSKAATSTITTTTTTTASTQLGGGIPTFKNNNINNNSKASFYENFVKKQQQQQHQETSSISFNNNKGLLLNDGIFLPSMTTTMTSNLSSLCYDHQEIQGLPYTNIGGCLFEGDNNNNIDDPCSISSTITPILYNFTGGGGGGGGGDLANNNSSLNTNNDHHYQHSATTTTTTTTTRNNEVMMGMSSNWGWDEFVEADLTIPWDDSDIKP